MNTRHLLLSSLAGAATALACGHPNETTSIAAADASTPIAVTVATVGSSAGARGTEVPGAIESARVAAVRSRIPGTVIEMTLHEGDRVQTGAVLARLDGDSASASLASAQARETAALTDLARATSLLAKNAATKSEVENATTAAANARAAVVAAREAVSWAVIRAPFAGRIGRKLASVGDSVNPGTPIAEIEGDGGLEAVASVEASVQQRLHTGQRIEVRVDGIDTLVSGVVRTIAPSADPATHRFTVRADVPAREGIRGGLFARLLVPGAGAETTMTVPASAVFRRGGLTGVYVVRDQRAWLRWIAPGEPVGNTLEVRAGLENGESVALDPSNLHDGARVNEGR